MLPVALKELWNSNELEKQQKTAARGRLICELHGTKTIEIIIVIQFE